jgi:hypothetical protein
MPEIDEMLTIEPPPTAFNSGIANFIPRKTPRALTDNKPVPGRGVEQILDGAAARPGIVDENIELAELGDRRIDGRLPLRLAGHVEMAEHRSRRVGCSPPSHQNSPRRRSSPDAPPPD